VYDILKEKKSSKNHIQETTMLRKIIGTVLFIVAGIIFLVLLMSGSPLLPHSIGPVVLALIGAVLFSPIGQSHPNHH
jgi:hypothetical protein